MSKRFTETTKWKDAWFMDLDTKYKLFWVYLLDECDHAGLWEVNLKYANFVIGETYTYDELTDILKDRVVELNEGKYWFIPKFISFQYGILNKNSKPHLSVIKRLEEIKEGLSQEYKENSKGLGKGMHTLKEKEKDKDKEKDKERGKEGEKENYQPCTLEEAKEYGKSASPPWPEGEIERWFYHYDSQGWTKGSNSQFVIKGEKWKSLLHKWINESKKYNYQRDGPDKKQISKIANTYNDYEDGRFV